uniref:Putative secreted peptide n=1 Tax=Anopheles braziliensis TaxID=58242 RepID=A0A2M3ZUZ1_9DIPT
MMSSWCVMVAAITDIALADIFECRCVALQLEIEADIDRDPVRLRYAPRVLFIPEIIGISPSVISCVVVRHVISAGPSPPPWAMVSFCCANVLSVAILTTPGSSASDMGDTVLARSIVPVPTVPPPTRTEPPPPHSPSLSTAVTCE